MSFFDLFKRPNIDQGVAEYKSVPGAVLLDVRTAEEYREGHIPDSKNVSLQAIGKVQTVVQGKDPPVCVLLLRFTQFTGNGNAQANGILQCKKYRWYCRLYRKGGSINEGSDCWRRSRWCNGCCPDSQIG